MKASFALHSGVGGMQSQASQRTLVERVVRNDRIIVIASVTVIVILSAFYTVFGVGMNMTALDMTRMARPIGEPMTMGMQPHWTAAYAVLIFLMWWVMMVAMMTPSAAPMVLLFNAVKKAGTQPPAASHLSLVFLSGYLATWAGLSVAAAALQWSLENVDIADGPMMALKSRSFAGLVMIAAGLFQFTNLKRACLSHCRSPALFLAEHSRPGIGGAFVMGAHHGLYCLGCCWALMALLFVGGIMNLYWIVGLAIYVLIEKVVPNGEVMVKVAGAALVAAGAYVLATGLGN